MIKINFEKEGTINDREFAFITLANACGKVLANRNLYPEDINQIAYSYLFTGCKSRYEYEYLVNFLIAKTIALALTNTLNICYIILYSF